MAIIEFLQEIGLTRNEAKIYFVLLKSGRSLAGTIAEKAKVHRRNVYDTLRRLVEKGLVSHIKKERREYYEAVNPEKVIDMLKEKVDIAQSILPELLGKYNKPESKQEVQILEGKGGMKTFFTHTLKSKGNLYCIGATGKATEIIYYFMPNYIKELSKKKRRIYILKNYDAKGIEEMEKLSNVTVKVLPNKFTTPTQMFFYEDFSAIAIWSETPIIVLIKSKEINNGLKKYFNFMWKLAK